MARLALVALALLGLIACASEPVGPAPAHLTQAEIWPSPSTAWAPPDRLSDADDAVLGAATPWQEVKLPHARPRGLARSGDASLEPPDVLWYRMTLPAAALTPTPQGSRLYIPRWHTLGTVAIYVDGVVAWQARGSRVWNGFNIPVWIDLAGRYPPGTSPVVHVRMASERGIGGALSTVWAGNAEALTPGWRMRHLLQRYLMAVARGAYLVLGVGALVVWLMLGRRRADAMYLLFFLMSVCHMLGTLQYLVGDETTGVADEWFSWLTLAGTLGSTLCSFYFLSRIQRRPRPRLGWALAAYVSVICLVALPIWGLSQEGIFPLVRMGLIPPSMLVLFVAVQGAWRQRDWPSMLLAIWIVLSFPIGFHDLGMQRYENLEHIYLSPYVYLGLFTMFLWIAMTRYHTALNVAERANTTLIDRLAEQEEILAETHARLRSVEREQTLLQERQRLMRDMHDGVGSSLMSALRVVEHGDTDRVDLAQVLKECIDDLKISIDSLEPVDADLLTLLANLRFRMGPRLEGAGLALDWQVNELPLLPWLDSASALHILRIIQEVLTNVIKHSGATRITVATAEAEDAGTPGVEVAITDNGRPFQPPSPAETPPARRGLSNVRSRAHALGAHIDWVHTPEGGTRFRMWLPLVHG
ncbi:histidine kinase [Ottowia sp. GY511]|nr:histidine kinase [Ottowia sp. GY511]